MCAAAGRASILSSPNGKFSQEKYHEVAKNELTIAIMELQA